MPVERAFVDFFILIHSREFELSVRNTYENVRPYVCTWFLQLVY
jgi:hypothetical protein